MQKTLKPRTGLMFIELIAAILIFSLAAGIVLQLFLGSRSLSRLSGDMNAALMRTQEVAGLFCARDGDLAAAGIKSEMHYDESWKEVPDGGAYILFVEATEEKTAAGLMKSAVITAKRAEPYPFLKGRTEIMTLSVSTYVAA